MRVLRGPESDALMRGTAHPRRPSGFPPCHPMLRGVRTFPAAPAPLRAPAVRELLGCPPFGRCLAGFWETLRGLPGASRGLPGHLGWLRGCGVAASSRCLPLIPVLLTASSAPLTAACLAPCLSLSVSVCPHYVLLGIHGIYSSYLVSSYILSGVF